MSIGLVEHISKNRAYYSILALALFNLLVMHYTIMAVNYERVIDLLRYFQPILPSLFDLLLLSLIASVFSWRHWKASAVAVYIITLLWSVINIVYSRFFGTYITLSALGQVQNVCDSFYLQYAGTAFAWSDILLVVGIVLFVFSVKRQNNLEPKFFYSINLKWFLSVAVCLYLFNTASASYRNKSLKLMPYDSVQEINKEASSWYNNFVFKNGTFFGQIGYYLLSSFNDRELTESDIRQIETYCFEKPHTLRTMQDSVGSAKNLIFILVESYLSVTSDLVVDSIEITPNLNRLKHLKNTYYNGRVSSNVAAGESSDGQFIYLTGLLPKRSSITINDVYNKKLFALPSLLKQSGIVSQNRMTIPTAPFVWRQGEMALKYGIDTLLSVNTSYMVDDKVVFDLASTPVATGKSFFHMVLTMSMHSPYDTFEGDDLGISFPDNYSPEYCNYLRACHFTDVQIGRYIDYLKREGIYDNSLIVIAADHQAHPYFLNMQSWELNDEKLPLYLINLDTDPDSLYQGEINQLDVFPTILDAMGCASLWSGLGCSIYRKDDFYNSVTDQAYEISDLVIDGDYFKQER